MQHRNRETSQIKNWEGKTIMNQFYEKDETILDEINTLSDLVNY